MDIPLPKRLLDFNSTLVQLIAIALSPADYGFRVFQFYFSTVQLIARATLRRTVFPCDFNSSIVQLITVTYLIKTDKESNSYTLSVSYFLRYFSVDP